MAKTSLIPYLLGIVVASGLLQGAYGQNETSIQSILDSLPADVSDGISADEIAIERWLYFDHLKVVGRHRSIAALPKSESKLGADRARDGLRRLGILDPVESLLRERAEQSLMESEHALLRGDVRLRDQLRQRAVALQSVLDPTRDRNNHDPAGPFSSTVRIGRSTDPLPLLAWNSGSFAQAITPNFAIASQAGERPTAEMAQACEVAYHLWSQLFPDFSDFEQTTAPKLPNRDERRRFRVVMFRTRDAYLKALRTLEPKINVSTGYYSPRHRISFFYWDGSKSLPTLIHELTHQFFQEAVASEPPFHPDTDPGFWAIEGVALYLESLSMQKMGGAVVIDVGGWDSPRLQAARYRRLHDEYWIPWERFSQLTGNDFRSSREISEWYSQACGLAHRWLDGSEAEFQQFNAYLRAVYAGAGSEAAWRLAPDDDSMRSGYDQYLLRSWQEPNGGSRPFFANRRDAVLSRCDATSRDLLAWPLDYRTMDWLDVSFCKIDDSWLLEAGMPSWQVVRLNLESTAVTDRALAPIGEMKELRELDLTRCSITDLGMKALEGHSNLRQLWIAHTSISDASIEVLLSLPRLELLVIDGSEISETGWQRILNKKPHLKR